MLASIVISTYNRADALEPTLMALARQDVDIDCFEVIVVDDGSTDQTSAVLASMKVPYKLRTMRQATNSGVSAGRNLGMREARGDLVIMISDDLVVPADFIRSHSETHTRFPNSWVTGGFSQLPDLTITPFGRYLDRLEHSFDVARRVRQIDAGIYLLGVPTARNMSMPREDLDRVGYFDESFRVTCEDQDLAERARTHQIRFVYNSKLECVHNDQAADLLRYCRFQERGAIDTARFCQKHFGRHGSADIVTHNMYLSRQDGLAAIFRKSIKRMLSARPLLSGLYRFIVLAEWLNLPDRVLFQAYSLLIGLHTFRGFRAGLEELGGRRSEIARRNS